MKKRNEVRPVIRAEDAACSARVVRGEEKG